MKQKESSGVHFKKLREKRTNAIESSQVFTAAFLKGSDPSASSGIQQHEQNESVFSQIQNDK
jgi:hypothetical protein